MLLISLDFCWFGTYTEIIPPNTITENPLHFLMPSLNIDSNDGEIPPDYDYINNRTFFSFSHYIAYLITF